MNIMTKTMSGGKTLPALSTASYIAIGVATLNQLEAYGLQRPSVVETAKVRDMKHDPKLKGAHDLRDQVQRRFDNARMKRAESYADYLAGVADGSLKGGVPPVTLFCPHSGVESEDGITLPYNAALVNLDGETQTEARFIRRDRNPASGDEVFPFILYHGIDLVHAGNIMHDVNVFAHPVSEKTTAPLNANGSVTQAVNTALANAGVPNERVNRHGEGVRKHHLTSFGRLMCATLGYETERNILRRNGVGAMLARYNSGKQSVDEKAILPFLDHVLALASTNRDIAKAPLYVWTLAGAVSKTRNRFITESEFVSAAAAYNAAKGSAARTAAALNAVGYSV